MWCQPASASGRTAQTGSTGELRGGRPAPPPRLPGEYLPPAPASALPAPLAPSRSKRSVPQLSRRQPFMHLALPLAAASSRCTSRAGCARLRQRCCWMQQQAGRRQQPASRCPSLPHAFQRCRHSQPSRTSRAAGSAWIGRAPPRLRQQRYHALCPLHRWRRAGQRQWIRQLQNRRRQRPLRSQPNPQRRTRLRLPRCCRPWQRLVAAVGPPPWCRSRRTQRRLS